MRPELEKIQYIEQYLENKLPLDEKIAFEQSLQNDPILAQEVELQKELSKRIQRSAIKDQLNEIHQNQFGTKAKKWWNHIWLNSLIAIIGIASILIYFTNEESPETHAEDLNTIQIFPIMDSLETDSLEIEFCDSIPLDTSVTNKETQNYFECPEVVSIEDKNRSEFEDSHQKNEITHQVYPLEKDTNLNIETIRNFDFLLPTQDTINYFNEKMEYKYSGSKTVLHLPANLISRDQTKDSVLPVQFLYREFRNQVDMVYSDIPMIYSDKKLEYQFNSSGMFEFTPMDSLTQLNRENIENFTIDFELIHDKDLHYYWFKDNQNWKKGIPIDYVKTVSDTIVKSEPIQDNQLTPTECITIESKGKVTKKYDWGWAQKDKDQRDSTNNDVKQLKGARSYSIRLFSVNKEKSDVQFKFKIKKPGRSVVLKANTTIHPLLANDFEKNPLRHPVAKDSLLSFLKRYSPECKETIQEIQNIQTYKVDSLLNLRLYQSLTDEPFIQVRTVKEKNTYTILGQPEVEKTPIVNGLGIEGFGVYNCGETYRIENQITAQPKFTFNSNLIHSIKLIDLNYNAVFEVKDQAVKLNPQTASILLIFTKDGKLFYANPNQMALLIRSPKMVLETNDITEIISTSNDLQKFIDQLKKELLH